MRNFIATVGLLFALALAPHASATTLGQGRGGSSSSGTGAVEDVSVGTRTAWFVLLDSAATNLTSFGLPAFTTSFSASGTLAVDTTTDATRMMTKLNITAASNYASHGSTTGTMRGWKPKLTARVYIPSIAAPSGGGTREFKLGFRGSLPTSAANGDCQTSAAGGEGAWVCYTDWTSAAGGGSFWILTTRDGVANVSTATAITVTAGMHTLILDMSDTSKVTLTVDGVLGATNTTSLPGLTTSIGPFIHAGTFAGLAAWSVSTPGFLLTQSW
jgi:hypothetical protein